MDIFLTSLLFIILVALAVWWLQASNWHVATAVGILLGAVFIFTLGFLITRPFTFGQTDANNIILYGIYLITAGALFFIPVTEFKDELLKGKMPVIIKQVLFSYLAYSAILLVLIVVEAFKIRG
ncbi:hypothetical protein LCGC14_1513750 [marine sediment metagenome]|uniref:Uncharacterized protein n=1 Tax=marine sediment metagenome TaxID=412755 RepID=A0A0F9J0V0_9ZZZZ